jgi:hypothetical protein
VPFRTLSVTTFVCGRLSFIGYLTIACVCVVCVCVCVRVCVCVWVCVCVRVCVCVPMVNVIAKKKTPTNDAAGHPSSAKNRTMMDA